jgi:hypothetical protein
MSRWEDERQAGMARLQSRDEHLEAAEASKPELLKVIGAELARKGIGEEKGK